MSHIQAISSISFDPQLLTVGKLSQEKVKTLGPTQAYRACLPMKVFLYPLTTPFS
jgi:hypothetical protein